MLWQSERLQSATHALNWREPVQAHGKTGGEAQEWARAMLGTVGRGGNAQVNPCCPPTPYITFTSVILLMLLRP